MIDPMDPPEDLRLLLEKRSGEERREAELASKQKPKSPAGDRRGGRDRRKKEKRDS